MTKFWNGKSELSFYKESESMFCPYVLREDSIEIVRITAYKEKETFVISIYDADDYDCCFMTFNRDRVILILGQIMALPVLIRKWLLDNRFRENCYESVAFDD